jgi:replicative DNA helicase
VQLAKSDNERDDDRQRVSKLSKMVMRMRKQLGVPWIVLAQMNRAIETSDRDRIPVLSDLKDCGDLEQDADFVGFTYKLGAKEVDHNPTGANGEELPSDREIIAALAKKKGLAWSAVPYRVDFVIPKNRYGPTGRAQMLFNGNLCKFEDWHQVKYREGIEELKQGEREKVMKPAPQSGFADVQQNFPAGEPSE